MTKQCITSLRSPSPIRAAQGLAVRHANRKQWFIAGYLPRCVLGVGTLAAAMAALGWIPHAQAQQSGGSTGVFQRHRMLVVPPIGEANDWTRDLFSDINRSADQYHAFKSRIQREYDFTWNMQVSAFSQWAEPDSGPAVTQFVWSPSVSWTPFRNTSFGTGQINVSFSQNQFWSRFTTSDQQSRMGTITAPNDWFSNNYSWGQVSYTHTLPGAMNWLSVTGGQFTIGNFDGDLYAGNAQTSFVTYALAQNATSTYPLGGIGAYTTVALPGTQLSFSTGFQGATDVSGRRLSVRGYETGNYAYFANLLYTPTVPGLGAGSYNFTVYHQPSVPAQPSSSTGYTFAMSQSVGPRYGVFARANTANGDVNTIGTSFAFGGVANDPFNRHTNDRFGLGLFVNRANRNVVGSSAVTPRLWEYGAEAFYNYTLFKGLQLTPNAAVFLNPVLDPSRDAAYLLTLRLTAFL